MMRRRAVAVVLAVVVLLLACGTGLAAVDAEKTPVSKAKAAVNTEKTVVPPAKVAADMEKAAFSMQKAATGARRTGGLEPRVGQEIPGYTDYAPEGRAAAPTPHLTDVDGNQLPNEVFMYRENMYNDFGKECYDYIYAGLAQAQETISIPERFRLTEDEMVEYMYTIPFDHPEMFWMGMSYSYGRGAGGYISMIRPHYNDLVNNRQGSVAAFERRVNPILWFADRFTAPVDKVRAVHDWITRSTVYAESEHDQNAYSMVVEGRTVCAGYAAAFVYCMQRLGIPAGVVSGLGLGGNHAWNVLELDGEYYGMDVTWDDPDDPQDIDARSYEYFNVTEAYLRLEHERDERSEYLPYAYGTRYSYDNYYGPDTPGTDFSTFDPNATGPGPAPTPVPTPAPTPAPEPILDVDAADVLPYGVHLDGDSNLCFRQLSDGQVILSGIALTDHFWPFEFGLHLSADDDSEAESVTVLDAQGDPDWSRVGPLRTGDTLVLLDADDEAIASYEVAVVGDVTGSGLLNLSQLVRMAQAFTGQRPLEGAYRAGADVSGSGRPVRLSDLTTLASWLLAG